MSATAVGLTEKENREGRIDQQDIFHRISGDREQPTRRLADALGVDDYFAETLPENKADLVQRFRQEGKFVCFTLIAGLVNTMQPLVYYQRLEDRERAAQKTQRPLRRPN